MDAKKKTYSEISKQLVDDFLQVITVLFDFVFKLFKTNLNLLGELFVDLTNIHSFSKLLFGLISVIGIAFFIIIYYGTGVAVLYMIIKSWKIILIIISSILIYSFLKKLYNSK
jgi:hypothetical protein